MGIVYLNELGQEIKFEEWKPEVNAGEPAKILLRFRSTYSTPAMVKFALLTSDPRLRIADYTTTVKPGEIGTIVFEVNAPEDSVSSIDYRLRVEVKLVG